MKTVGFWTGGPDEHRRAVGKHITELRTRLESCEPESREQPARQLEQALEELKKSDDNQIFW